MKENLTNIMPIEKAEQLESIGKIKRIEINEYFIRKGEIPHKFAFVKKGLFRYVYINDKGVEYTKGIIPENNFIISYSAMICGTPSYFFIQALEKAEIFEIRYYDWQKLLESDVFWTKFLLKFIEKGFMLKENRERDLLLFDAETRYTNFLKEFPHIEKRVKQIVIASFLGIQPESLSRIKKKLQS